MIAELLPHLGSDIKQAGHGKGCVCLYANSHTVLPSTPGSYPLLLPAPLDPDPIFIFLSLHLRPLPSPKSLLLDWCRIMLSPDRKKTIQENNPSLGVNGHACHFITPSTCDSTAHLVEMPSVQGHAQQWAEHLIQTCRGPEIPLWKMKEPVTS